VMTWLLNSMHEKVSASVMFLKTAKEIRYFEGDEFQRVEYFSCC